MLLKRLKVKLIRRNGEKMQCRESQKEQLNSLSIYRNRGMEDGTENCEEQMMQEAFMEGYMYAIQVLQEGIAKKTK